MIILVKFIGIFMACMGVTILLNPGFMKKMIAFWRQGKRAYIGGLLRILFGLIFLSSASQARFPALITGLGIFLLIAGIFIFVLGLEKMKAMLGWWDKKPLSVLRLMGLLVFAIGILIIYSV
jgi:uncharacterized protein YjeT (DUF2065 family)